MSFSIRRGDIFYVHKFGIQVGSEEHTGRPGVVVSCDEGNRYSETVQVAFCTTQPKSNLPTHVEILSTGRASTVMCEQINTVSLERLGNYIGRCTAEEMRDIDIAVATALGLKKYPGLIERLKEREQQVEKREAVVGKETDTKAALELATVKAERDTYRRLYEDLIRGFIPTAPAGPDTMAYDIYCAFDLEKHKQTYVQYLEVVILEDGTVEYAVPSHQEKLIALACQKQGVSRQELNDLCPREYYYDFLTWLCMQANAVAVWNNDCCYGLGINRKQIGTLRKLKMAGVYGGTIPKI